MASLLRDRLTCVLRIAKREVGVFKRRPLLIFCMLVAPIIGMLFFASMLQEGLPAQLPTGLVDEDDTQTTRSVVRVLSAMRTTGLKHRYASFSEARQAMQRGEIYAFFYIPEGTTREALANRQPKISFYTNDSYFVAGSLLMRDLRTISEMAGLAITKATLQAKGMTDDAVMALIQPIVVESHPLGNVRLNYAVLLVNLIMPGIIVLLIMLSTTYALGIEWKAGTQLFLLDGLAHGSVSVALAGKLLPQTCLYSAVFCLMDVYFYSFLLYPCECGVGAMMLLGLCTVIVAQAMGVIFFGLFPGQMRMAMSGAALVGVLSIPLAGFSFPTTAMLPLFQGLAWAAPLRSYFLIYVNQALYGYPLIYAWKPIVAMLTIVAVALLVAPRIGKAFRTKKYVP